MIEKLALCASTQANESFNSMVSYNVQRQGIIVAVKVFPTELQRLSARRMRDTHILKISQADWELHQGVF